MKHRLSVLTNVLHRPVETALPSGHSSFAMLVTASLWAFQNRKWRVAGVLFVLWVGISSVSLGAHFPADVLAGFSSSLVVVLPVYAVIRKLMRLIINRTRATK